MALTVALDITLTEELKREGIARDFVNRVQNSREDMGLEVLDKISIEVERIGEVVTAAMTEHKDIYPHRNLGAFFGKLIGTEGVYRCH
ncbi:MAG: DUF5915 domain-containing protein [Cytophagales bacterium]|nr:DUF5915 domain-containing protein [Cytophagales bacterium]